MLTIIQRCPTSMLIHNHTDAVKAGLIEQGFLVEVHDGAIGQFAVEVDGQIVAEKMGTVLPTVKQVGSAVQNASLVGAEA